MKASPLPSAQPGAPRPVSPGDSGAANSIQARMDTLVGTLLLIGVMASLALVAAGAIWSFLSTGRMVPNYRIVGMNFFAFAVATAAGLRHGRLTPKLLINTRIVTLMLTPFLRVLASMLYFLTVKNPKYTAFTAFVLAVLAWSLFLRH